MLVPTTILAQQHLRTFQERFEPYPVQDRGALAASKRRPSKRRSSRAWPTGTVDIVIGTHRLLSKDVVFKDLGLCHHRRGAALRRRAKGAAQGAAQRRGRADADGDADSPHLAHGDGGRPGHEPHRDAARRSLSDPHVRGGVRRRAGARGDPAGARPAAGRFISSTTECRTSTGWPSGCGSWCPRPASPSPTARWTRTRLERVMLDFLHGEYDVLLCSTIIETGMDIANVNTLDRLRRGPLWPGPAVPAAGAGGAQQSCGLRVFHLSAGTKY